MPLYAAVSSKGGVASQVHSATIEGLRILECGGNAFDAAITVSSLLTILLPHTGSVGGDGFLLALKSNGELVAYNGSGRSARKMPVEEYLAKKPTRGPLTITVPGLVDLWEKVNEDYGSMHLARLLQKAISLAANGVNVQEALAKAIEASRSALAGCEGWNHVFGGLGVGSWVRFPRLAKLYRAIARSGADAFYRSEFTEELVAELNRQGAVLAYKDFVEHRGEEVSPIECKYRGFDLYELPPNTQGLSTLQLLKAMELAELYRMPFESAERVREFLRLSVGVYEDRDVHIADPRFHQAPIEMLLSPTYLKERLIKEACRSSSLEPGDTTFFTVADGFGNFVGFIQSIFHGFGSGIVACDIPFHNRGAGFSPRSGTPNSPAPSKRPLHTLSILLARHDSQGDYLIGCAGGDFRPQIHAEVMANTADHGMPLSEAVEAPRCIMTCWDERAMEAYVEEGLWSPDLPSWVKKMGYQSSMAGIVHAARRRRDGVFEFVADPRGGGVAAVPL
jgi:gamma-glutamyltranspeptidase/glutathione hydrolase